MMNKNLLILIMICISINVFGQPKHLYRDTINIDIENVINIKIASFEMSWLINEKEIFEILNVVKSKIDKISDSLPAYSFKLIYCPNQDIIVKKLNDNLIFSINGQEDIVKSSNNQCVILTPKYDIYINFKSIDELLSIDIQNYVNKILLDNHTKDRYSTETPDKPYFHGISWTDNWVSNNDSVSIIGSRWNPHKDNLEILAGVGVGFIKNQISSDFSFRLGYYRNQKGGCLKKHLYISDNINYFFNEAGDIQLNNFLNIGFRYNLSNKVFEYKWIGLEFGYLTNSNGDYFKTPSFRLGTYLELKKRITISPQIYFENGFKKVYPGLRFGINIGP